MADISNVKLKQTSAVDSKKLGLIGLIGVVAGSMIGGAIFNLPSNMSSTAGAGAVLIAWGLAIQSGVILFDGIYSGFSIILSMMSIVVLRMLGQPEDDNFQL